MCSPPAGRPIGPPRLSPERRFAGRERKCNHQAAHWTRCISRVGAAANGSFAGPTRKSRRLTLLAVVRRRLTVLHLLSCNDKHLAVLSAASSFARMGGQPARPRALRPTTNPPVAMSRAAIDLVPRPCFALAEGARLGPGQISGLGRERPSRQECRDGDKPAVCPKSWFPRQPRLWASRQEGATSHACRSPRLRSHEVPYLTPRSRVRYVEPSSAEKRAGPQSDGQLPRVAG
jgi:hypothetical protein